MIHNDKFNRKPVQVAAAQAMLREYAGPAAVEMLDLEQCDGRILAENLCAPHPYPVFRRSGMDGYAVLALDTTVKDEEPIWLRVVDYVPCGKVPSQELESGQAARIMTGAQVPDGADAVVMMEAVVVKTDDDGSEWVGIKKEIESGKNITPVGFEIKKDQLLLEKGKIIGPGEISVLATFGIHQVAVYRRPRVGVFATGTELLDIRDPLEPGKIRNSNSYMLASQIREAGGEAVMMEAIPDDMELAAQRVEEAMKLYDIVVTTGGVSVGDYDIMGDLVRSGSMNMLFNKVAMRPGSVTTAAVKDDKVLFALSGNPGACYVGFLLFVRPMIRQMLGMQSIYLTEWEAELSQDYNRVNNFTRFVRGQLEMADGRLRAVPAMLDESSVMVTIKDSSCLIIIPPELRGATKGQKVKVLLLPGANL